MANGRTPLTAANIMDALGNPLASGTLQIIPTDGSDRPITAVSGQSAVSGQLAGGPILISAENPAYIPITSGALPANTTVADTTLTRPANISYRLTVVDGDGVPLFTLTGVQSPQDGTGINLDTWLPNVASQAIVQYGPPGPPASFRGAYVSGTTYALGDAVASGGSSYVSVVAGNTGNDPATSTSHWALLAAKGSPGDPGDPGLQGAPGVNSTVGNVSGTFGRQAYAGDGATSAFTKPVNGVSVVYYNGLLQEPGPDYTESTGSVATTFTPSTTDRLSVMVFPSLTRQTAVADGATTAFAKPLTWTAAVFVNGLLQDPASYTETSSTITFNSAPASGDRVTLLFYPAN